MGYSDSSVFLGIINLFSTIITLYLTIIVLIRLTNYKIKIISGLIALSITLLNFSVGISLINYNNPQIYSSWFKLSYFGLLFPPSLVLFSYIISRNLISLWNIIGLYSLTLFLIITAYTNYGIEKIVSIFPFIIQINSIYNICVQLWILILILVAFYQIYAHYKITYGTEKLKFKYLLTVYILTMFLVIMLQLSNMKFLPYLSIFLTCIPIIILNLLIKEQLLSIELFVYETGKFIFSLLIVLVLNYIFLNYFKHLLNSPELFSSSISLIMIGLFFFSKSKNRVEHIMKSVFLNKKEKYKKIIFDATQSLTSILDINELLEYIVKTINKALNTNKIGIFLKEGDRFRLVASHGLEKVDTIYLENQQLIRWLNRNKAPFVLDTAWQKFSSSEYDKIVKDLGMFGAILVIPLIYKGEVKGVMTLDQKKTDGMIFDIDDIEILNNLGNELAIAIENAELYKRLDDAYMNITRALSIAVEQKEGYTVGHSDNVTKYALLIANKMGLSQKEIIDITQAAMLHDIGKIGIKDSILSKPGKLNEEEWREMRQHSEKGAKILSPLHMISVSEIVTHHHERYDGKGYPEGLKGDEIPLGAQILCVADSFDAMVTERPYRDKETKRLTIDEAVEELVKNKGTQFNPKIVDTFIEIIKENPNIFSKKEK